MTRPEVAEAKIVTTARLPVAVLVALRNEAMTGFSSCEQIAQEGNPDVSGNIRQQRQLFEEASPVPIVDLPPALREQLRQALTQWMLAHTATMRKEVGDE
jgi:CheY-like chemotaxis protein